MVHTCTCIFIIFSYSLGSHALQIARIHAHLSYFAHVLKLMLHKILEEEVPGSIPIPGTKA